MPKFSNPYERKYVESRIRSIEFDISLVGNIDGLIENYSYKNNTNPESNYNYIYNTGYFYITEEILKEFNILFETKFPLHQFFLEKEIFINLIINLPKLRQRLYFKGLSQDINTHNKIEVRLLDLFYKNSLYDSTLTRDSIDNKSYETFTKIRNGIFKQNLDLISNLFFSPTQPFFIDNVKFSISYNPPPKLEDKFLKAKQDKEKNCGEIEKILSHNISNTKLLQIIVARDQSSFNIRNILSILSGRYSIDYSDAYSREQFKTLHEQESRGNYRTSEAIAKEIIKKIKNLAYRCDIKLGTIEYVPGDGIHIQKRLSNYYKDFILIIGIIPYDERYSFRLKNYCTTSRANLISNICTKLTHDDRINKKNLPIFCSNVDSLGKNNLTGNINYKLFIREYKDKQNKKKRNKVGGMQKRTRRKYKRRSIRRKSRKAQGKYKH